MPSPLEWALKIVDAVSAPTKAATNALKNFATAAKAADSATSKPIKMNISQRVKQEVTKAKADFKQFGSDVAETFGGIEMIAAGAIAGIYAGAGLLAAKGSKMAIDAVTFRENTTLAFKALLGSQRAAAGLYEKVLDVADRVGLEKEQAVASVKKLLSAGFDETGAIAVLEAIANTAAVLGEGAATKLEKFFLTLQATGKANLDSLAKSGINVENIYARLAKTTGKTVEQVKALAKAGKIDKATMLKAVSDEVNKGDIGETLGNSLDRIFGDISGKFARMFDKVDIGPLRDAAKAVLAAFDGPAGEKMRAGINKIFGGIFDALFGAFDAGRVDAIFSAIGDAMNIVGDIIQAVAPAVKEFIGGLVDGFTEAWPIIKGIGGAIASALGVVGGAGGFFKMMGQGIAYVIVLVVTLATILGAIVGAVVYVGAAIIGVFAAIVGVIGSVAGAIAGFFGHVLGVLYAIFVEIPIALITALVNGITGGVSSVVQAIVGLASAAIGAAKSVFGIASPSKVFTEIGSFTAQGFAGGVASDNSPQAAVDTMVAPPSGLSAEQAGAAAAGGRSGGGGGAVFYITVTGGGDGDEIADKIERRLDEYWEALQQAVGA